MKGGWEEGNESFVELCWLKRTMSGKMARIGWWIKHSTEFKNQENLFYSLQSMAHSFVGVKNT